METEEKKVYPFGKLELHDALYIAGRTNSFVTALQEHSEGVMADDEKYARFVKKGVDLGDTILDSARILTSRGVFSQERYLSEILIYCAGIVRGCEVCALTHIEGAIRAKAPEAIIDTVKKISHNIKGQANDETYLLLETYIMLWGELIERSPLISSDHETSIKFYNLIALLVSMVVKKMRLVRFHTYELLHPSSTVTPEEILEVIGIAQVMGGLVTRWEAVHIFDIIHELHQVGVLPEKFVSVLALIPKPRT